MKTTLLYILIAVGLLTACQDEQTHKPASAAGTADQTDIQWIDSAKDMGKINEGQIVEVAFRFKNTGNKPLVIEGVSPSCGCTVANPPAEPIAPGAEGEIKASFNSKGRVGINQKDINVNANTKGTPVHKLSFKVEVIPQQTN